MDALIELLFCGAFCCLPDHDDLPVVYARVDAKSPPSRRNKARGNRYSFA
jgi:hypothetical protein